MSTRIAAAVSAMVTLLTLGWLMLSPLPQGEAPTPLRLILSVLLIFGISSMAATFALLAHHHETHTSGRDDSMHAEIHDGENDK